jgi:regulator of protease activity HflC (stomatin/prohibitin superfamily)
MAEIRRLPWLRHLRAETTSHILAFRRGRLTQSGRGLAFWFLPMSAAIAEVPVDDRDLQFLFHGRSRDYQDIVVQGVITYRVVDAQKLAERIDFSIDLESGAHKKQPLEQLNALLTGLAQQEGLRYVALTETRQLLVDGFDALQHRIDAALTSDEALSAIGLEVVDVRVFDLAPSAELQKALQTPTREALQQAADEATFQRRALAVEKERAIAENELHNQVELSKREAQLIAQQGSNAKQKATEQAAARQIEVEARAENLRVESAAQANKIRTVELAKVEAEHKRLDAYRDLPTPVMLSLAAQDVAGNLSVEHLNITPEMFTPLITRLIQAGSEHLEGSER